MDTEIEAKFLDINPAQIREKLKNIGARLIFAERLMKRKNFDFPDKRLETVKGWVRVRDEGGGKVTLSYKQLFKRNVRGMKEVETEVKNFEDACDILLAIGLEAKAYQETKREKWMINDVEVVIDTWPWIPTFIEIEAQTEKKLKEAVKMLDLDWSRALHGSVEIAYQKYFDISEHEINNCGLIVFEPVPKWLEDRRMASL